MDIQFLRGCNDILLDLIKDNDILFQHEDPKVEFKTINTGFMVIKCNEKTFKLFDECSKFNADKYKFFDQSIIQDYIYLINTNCVKWDVLPLEFYNKIHGDILPENIILHHANLTFKEIDKDGKLITSLEKKIEQLNLVKNEVLNRK